ncbi:MAG TPA: hypothetical protein VLF67_04160 [Candidatus Saccharimonas sp.]|nr:hypothetical protein [Candidatus Saccharimonas sp.]
MIENITNPMPTPEEIDKAADVLGRLEPGYLPRPVFDAIVRLIVVSVVELVPVRTVRGRTEVLLTQREPDDPIWPSMWHNPGSVIRPTDVRPEYADTLARLLDEELGGTATSGELAMVGPLHFATTRGWGNAVIYWTVVTGEPKAGRFFDAQQLPERFVESQRLVVEGAVAHYEQARSRTS